MKKERKLYVRLLDDTVKKVHSIDFSNREIQVVDYDGWDGLAEWDLETVEFLAPELSKKQQIVYKWLIHESFYGETKRAMDTMFVYINMTAIHDAEDEKISAMVHAYEELSDSEFAEVLCAFGKAKTLTGGEME